MKLITRALIVIVIPFWGEPWHGTDSMVGKRGEVVGAFERNISCGGGRQLPREWFKTRGEWKLRMPRRYHGGRGTHKSGTLTLSQRQPSTTTTSPSYSPPLHPRPILQTSWNQISTLFPAIIITFSYNFYSVWKIINLVPLDNSKTATFLTIILKLQTPSTLNVESLEPLELLRKVRWIQFSNSSIWFGHLMSLIEIFLLERADLHILA